MLNKQELSITIRTPRRNCSTGVLIGLHIQGIEYCCELCLCKVINLYHQESDPLFSESSQNTESFPHMFTWS